MKKLLTTIALAGATYGAFAQGTVLFDNNNSGEVDLDTIGLVKIQTANASGAGTNPGGAVWHVALLYSATPGGGIAQNQLTEIADYVPSATTNPGIDGAGYFQDTAATREVTVVAPTASGTATFEVVSWIGTATTWASVLASGGATYETQGAQLVEFTAKVANPATTPPGIPASINTAGAWSGNAILTPVPEPTTIALGGLGAAALLLFRRRK